MQIRAVLVGKALEGVEGKVDGAAANHCFQLAVGRTARGRQGLGAPSPNLIKTEIRSLVPLVAVHPDPA